MKLSGRGLTGTIITHALLLALLILGGLTFPVPPPEEEGILVNFGTDDTGFGLVEPEGDESNAGTPDPVVEEFIPEPVQESAPDPVADNNPVQADNTQDLEETVVKEKPQPTPEELRKAQEEADRIRREQEAERQARLEEERRQRELEAERERQLEEERKKRETADRLNRLGQNTFGNQGVGESEGSQGVNPGTGTNQGTTTGTPGADNYGEGSGLGDGISYGLGSRKAVGSLPKPNVDNCQVTARIVVEVEIQVDRSGSVTSAAVKRATYQDSCIWNTVLQAARRTKFSAAPSATFKEEGWIRYIIEP